MAEVVVLDTNVILSDVMSIRGYPGKTVVIPMAVLQELDNFKQRNDEVGQSARNAHRLLDAVEGDLTTGATTGNVTIRVLADKKYPKIPLLIAIKNRVLKIFGSYTADFSSEILTEDDKIIAAAVYLKRVEKASVTLISQDLNMRIKARALGLNVAPYTKLGAAEIRDEIYTGYKEILVTPAEIEEINKHKEVLIEGQDLLPNQCVMLKSIVNDATALGIHKKDGIIRIFVDYKNISGIKFKNREQRLAANLLMDSSISFVSLFGIAGTGKTICALACAMEQIKNGAYNKLIIMKPMVSVGKELGYLPGSKEEKIRPWMGSIYDNLEQIVTKQGQLEEMELHGELEFEAMALIRGRSLPNCIILIDEAQNLSPKEIKTIVSRAGFGSKVIITADIDQIDSTKLDCLSNGAVHAAEKFKNAEAAAHITLVKGERSELATLAAELL